jgi:hypothetical protein
MFCRDNHLPHYEPTYKTSSDITKWQAARTVVPTVSTTTAVAPTAGKLSKISNPSLSPNPSLSLALALALLNQQ